MKAGLFVALLVPSLLSGCSFLGRFVDQAMDSAGGKVGNAVGDQVGMAMSAQVKSHLQPYTAEMTQQAALGLFTSLYYFGGYAWATKAYKPGEYTQWETQDEDGVTLYEKAYLKREADGKEWWRVRQTPNGGSGELIFEALLAVPGANGAQQILRLRAQLPGQENVSEVPIAKGEQSKWQLRPAARLTADSVEGATLGWEPVKSKAGLFKARHVRYLFGGGHMDWWLCNDVPGGVVKFNAHASGNGEGEAATLQLSKFGSGAKSLVP